MSYSLAAFRPRIFFLVAVVTLGKSENCRRPASPVDEALDLPLRLPDAVVAAEGHLVLADPEQQLAHDPGEELRPRVHQAADDHRQAGVDVGLLRRHVAEVVDPRQAHVLDDEVQLGEVGRGVVHVGDVERVLVQRPDRRALVHVDVLDAELLRLLQVPVGGRVAQLVAARAVVPLRGVELHALGAVPLDVAAQLLQAVVAVARVEPGVGDEHPRVLLAERRVPLGGVEPLLVPLLEVGRLEDRHVHVPVLEDVLHQVVFGVLLELVDRPVGLLRAEATGRRGSTRSSPWRTAPRQAPSCRARRSSSACASRR